MSSGGVRVGLNLRKGRESHFLCHSSFNHTILGVNKLKDFPFF